LGQGGDLKGEKKKEEEGKMREKKRKKMGFFSEKASPATFPIGQHGPSPAKHFSFFFVNIYTRFALLGGVTWG
jgi:hypothetical protein